MNCLRHLLSIGLLFVWSCSFAQLAAVLERNGSVSWRFVSGQYEITGAVQMSGDVTGSDSLVFSFQDLDNDGVALDVRLSAADMFPGIGINYTIDLIGTVVSDSVSEAIVQWFASDDPNRCEYVNVGGVEVQALITHLEGGLRGRITRIECQPDPLGVRQGFVTLRIEPTGGDDHNYLLVQGYLLCLQDPQFFAVAHIFAMDWLAYGGGSAGGDVDSNGCVDDADLLTVLFNFGGGEGCADINGDGVVDDADLLTVLFNFGSGC